MGNASQKNALTLDTGAFCCRARGVSVQQERSEKAAGQADTETGREVGRT